MLLTDRIEYSGASGDHLIHIVVTGDTSQNPAGSSFKLPLSKVVDIVPYATGGTYNSITGDITFTNSTGGTFVVSGITCDTIEITNSEFLNLIDTNSVKVGCFYKITDPINADEGVIVQGVITNSNSSLQGSGIFLNADYQGVGDYSGVSGYTGNIGIWGTTPRSVSVGNVVLWNNLHYKNLTGSWGSAPTGDSTNWVLLTKSVTNGYIREIDFIKYNVYTNLVIYRADRRLNEVDYATFGGSDNNFNEFQWGKDRVTGNKLKGKGRMNCANSNCTFTNNLIEGTLTDTTQVNGFIGSYISNIISNESYITCTNYNYGFVTNNSLTGASYILFGFIEYGSEIIKNTLNTSSYIDINITAGYRAFVNNILQNESYFICPNIQASLSNNSINNRSWIIIDICEGVLMENRLNCGSQLLIDYVQTLIQFNQLDNNSVITINQCQTALLKNTLDKSTITISTVCNYTIQRNYLSHSVITVPTFNASFEENNLQNSGIVGTEFNFTNYILNCIVSNYSIDLSVITNGQQYKTLNLGYSNFDKTLDLDNPTIYDLSTQTLIIQDFGIIGIYRLTNTTSKTISKITTNYGGDRVMRYYTDSSLDFQHTLIASATDGDLVCDAPSSIITIIGRTIGSDFIEYQQSIDGGQCLNLRTNLVKLA